MQKAIFKSLRVFAVTYVLIAALISCGDDSGLGGQVDVSAPTIDILYPPASAIVRDSFVFAGVCDDDVGVSAIAVTITNVDTKQTYPSDAVAINAKEKNWNVTINKYDETTGWQLPDGKYEISVVARDDAGRTSGTTQRTFEIDNTPPLVILRSPATTDLKNPTAYGTTFKITGTIADMHTISKMALTIADEKGDICADTDSTPFIIEDVPTAGGTDVTVLQFGAQDERGVRYKSIYGEGKDGGTKTYRCAVTIADNAKRYQNPDENLEDESLVAAKEGNGTSVVYLHDDVYKTLMSESSGRGLSAAELMQILNGTYTKLEDEEQEEIRAFLREKAIATTLAKTERSAETAAADGDDNGGEKSFLAFSLNPAVNPTYTVSGYNRSKDVSAPAKLPATVFVNKGLDENALLEPETFKAYAKDLGSVVKDENGAVSAEYWKAFDAFVHSGTTGTIDANDPSVIVLGSNEGKDSSSVDTYSWSLLLPESVTPGHWYAIVVVGNDNDGNLLYPSDDEGFGFLGSSTGFPPTVRVGEYKQAVCDSDAIKIPGTATSNDYAIASISYTVKVSDMDAEGELPLATYKRDDLISAEGENKTVSFEVDITTFDGYTKVEAGKNYRYDIVISATDVEGNECLDPAEVTVLVDTQPPVWKDEGETAFVVGGKAFSATSWYNTDELTFVGYFFENEHGTGFDTAGYRISSEGEPERTDTLGLNKTTGTARFQAAISDIKHKSHITFTATDNAGNTSQPKTIEIQIDTNEPEITEVIEHDFTTPRPASVAADAENVTVAFYIADKAGESGIDESSLVIAMSGKERKESDDYTKTVDPVGGNEAKKKVTVTFKKTALQNLDGTINVSATIKDKAGNMATSTVAILEIDSTPPEVKITGVSPVTVSSDRLVNKKITVTGTASDSHEITKITLTGTADGKTEKVECTNENGIWTATLDTENLYAGTESRDLTLTVTARDSIGNETPAGNPYTYSIPLKIDQNSDRPVIKVTNLQNGTEKDTYVLKYGGDKTEISGTITDDDADENATVTAFYVAKAPLGKSPAGWTTSESGDVITATHAVYGTTTLNRLTGDWTYTPAESDRGDGEKRMYFYVKDTAGTEFYTDGAASPLDRPYWQFKSDTATKADDGLAYTVDNNPPKISAAKVYAYGDSGKNSPYFDTDDKSKPVETSTVLGGKKACYAQFVITATDENDIDSLKVTLQGNGSADKEISGTLTDDTWTSAVTDLQGFTTGPMTLVVVATDKSGITGNGQFNCMVDFAPPKIESITPNTSVEQIGSVTVSGFAVDQGAAGVASKEDNGIQFAIPNANGNVTYGGNLAATATTSAWSFICNGNNSAVANPTFLSYVEAYKAANKSDDYWRGKGYLVDGKISEQTDIWSIPVYFRVTDVLGNTADYKDYAVRYNPNADMPHTTISYPSKNDYNEGEDFATLSAQIRVTGGVTITSPDVQVAATYLQVGAVKEDSTVDWTEGKAWVDGKSIESDGLKAFKAFGENSAEKDLNVTLTNIESLEKEGSWWGIKATNTTAWSVTLNKNDGLSPQQADDINRIAIRACAVNSVGKMGNWSEVIYINVDNAAPKLTYMLRQYDGDPKTARAIAEKPYVADMYLRNPDDNWWIEIDMEDPSGIDIGNLDVKKIGVTTTKGDDQKQKGNAVSGSSNHYNYIYYIPVSSVSGMSSYTISVPDFDTNGSHTTRMTFTLNVDNDAPNMDELLSDIKRTDSAVKYTKLRNSNYGVTITATAKDSGSGFSRLAYFFRRAATNTIELPVLTASGGNWAKPTGGAASMTISDSPVDGTNGGTAVGPSEKDDPSGLYGVWLKGGARSGDNTFEHSLVPYYAGKGLIRTGSLAKIGGTYLLITNVSGTTVTFKEAVTADFTDAFFALAFIVDNTTSESGSWASGSLAITNDDGDGMVESVKKSGATWTWESTFRSDVLQDGPIDIVCAAFDVAENVATQTTPVMIANNTPRLTKVFLATDLNGNGTYEQSEFVAGSVYLENTGETDSTRKHNAYLSALNSNTASTEAATAIVTVGATNDWTDNSANGSTPLTKLFRVSDNSVITMEFVGNTYEGYGSGNGDMTAYLTAGGTALTAPETTNARSIGTLQDKNTLATIDYAAAKANRGILLPKTYFYNNNALVSTYGTYTESTKGKDDDDNNDVKQYLSLTLWDSTLGTTPGVPDQKSGDEVTFGSQYTVLNIPVYYDFVDDRAPKVTLPAIAAAMDGTTPIGHVEQSDSLPEGHFGAKGSTVHNGTRDRDPKLSGKVVFTGTITENKRIQTISVQMSGGSGGGKSIGSSTATEVAKLENGKLKVTNPTDGAFTFVITKESFTQQDGHTVEYTLTVDTAKVRGYTANDIQFTLTANDYGGTSGSNPSLSFDVVPYITGITREATTNSVANTTYRSTYGEYPVAVGDRLLVKGFNLGDNPTVNVGKIDDNKIPPTDSNVTATKPTVSGTHMECRVTDFTQSGELTFTVDGITNLNQYNNNGEPYNQEEPGEKTARSSGVAGCILYDNRYLRVWDVNHPFVIDGGHNPTMATDNAGNIFSTWTLMGSGQVQMQRKLNTTSQPIYVGYDQPDKETALAVAQKSGSDVSVLFFPANVGSSGTPDSTGYADAKTMGGAWGVGLNNTFTNGHSISIDGSKKYLRINGNPYHDLDGKVFTSGYQLASASMRREVSQFKQGRTARYGDNMHFVYYDSYNKALRYTFQSVNNKNSNPDADQKDIVGWILIDGKSDDQDRIHHWTGNDLEYIWSNNGGGVSTLTSVNGTIVDNGKAIEIDGDWRTGAKAVAVSYVDGSAKYRVFLQPVTASYSNGRTKYTWNDTFPGPSAWQYYTPTGLAVYKGDSNVVPNGATKVDAAGSYSGMDVTTSGKPVIVYFDADYETLRIAYSTTDTPDMYNGSNGRDTFTRQSLAGIVSGSTHVQCKIDSKNYLHIMYRDSSGNLCYIKSTNAPDGAAYTFEKKNAMTIDTSGTYGTLSLIKSSSEDIPCVSWLNSEGTANGVKYALLRQVDRGNGKTEALWDVQVVPAVKSNYVVGGETVYVEGRKDWSASEGGVSTGDCDAIVGYNTGRMDVLFLKSAK